VCSGWCVFDCVCMYVVCRVCVSLLYVFVWVVFGDVGVLMLCDVYVLMCVRIVGRLWCMCYVLWVIQ